MQSHTTSGRIMRLLLALGLPLAAAIPLHAQADADKDVAVLLKTVGKVSINRAATNGKAGDRRWYVARRGLRLHSGNVLQTNRNSLASIVFSDDKSLLKVRQNSRVTIRSKRQQKQVEKTLFVRLGELWSRVTKGSFYRVETPSGVAAVKGTEFYTLYNQAGQMIIFCIEGIIELSNALGRVLLQAGERGELDRNTAPTKRPIGSGELPTWGTEGEGGEIEMNMENAAGQKIKLRIQYQ